jgi:hypothetical protein
MGSETNMIEAATTNEITMHMTAVAVPRAVACSGVTSPLRGTRRPLKGLVASILLEYPLKGLVDGKISMKSSLNLGRLDPNFSFKTSPPFSPPFNGLCSASFAINGALRPIILTR